MTHMRHLDHLDLDGHLLNLLVAVVDTGSVTRAAVRLGVTQSAVSHLLDKLRAIVGDRLFVKAGRGIAPTPQALLLACRARTLLDELRAFSSTASFDPAKLDTTLTVAANELQSDLLLPALLRDLRARAPGLSLRVIRSGVPTPALLRDDHCQLLITPRPPDGDDILHTRLFEDHYAVFYDGSQRDAPLSADAYLQAEHVTVLYEPQRRLDIDDWLASPGVHRRFVAQLPGMGGIGPFLRGSRLVATAPSLLRANLLRGFDSAPVPLSCPPMPIYAVWHRKLQADAAQRWLRESLLAVVGAALAAADAS